tara:strand:+ start:139 stop:618 length:480 start_codon:yes stop_codon:yes gene_type:complete
MQISLYSIIVILFYTIGSLLYLFSIFKSRDLLNPLSNIMKKIVSYGLIVCMYLPFLICFILILKRKQINNYNDFLLVNSIWLLLFVTPMIVFRNSIFNYKGTTINLSEEDLVDYSEYDDEGNLIVGSKKSMSAEERRIKERAAKSEYNERTDMDRGIYS